LDFVITKKLPFPVYLTSCSALSSDNLPVLIDTSCFSFFHYPPDRPDFWRTDWANFQTQFEELIPFDPELQNEVAIDNALTKLRRRHEGYGNIKSQTLHLLRHTISDTDRLKG
jgi:hypothetical protein